MQRSALATGGQAIAADTVHIHHNITNSPAPAPAARAATPARSSMDRAMGASFDAGRRDWQAHGRGRLMANMIFILVVGVAVPLIAGLMLWGAGSSMYDSDYQAALDYCAENPQDNDYDTCTEYAEDQASGDGLLGLRLLLIVPILFALVIILRGRKKRAKMTAEMLHYGLTRSELR